MGKALGMQAMDDALFDLLEADTIDAEACYEKAVDKGQMRERLLKGGVRGNFDADD